MGASILGASAMIGFVPAKNAADARNFYEGVLGFSVVSEDGFATVVQNNGTHIRIVNMGAFVPAKYTILGWEVVDMEAAVAELRASGVAFERYSHIEQDANAIWTTPDGSRVAWFSDPSGNILSISQHPTA